MQITIEKRLCKTAILFAAFFSSIVTSSLFNDVFVLPKWILLYFFTGISLLFLTLSSLNEKTMPISILCPFVIMIATFLYLINMIDKSLWLTLITFSLLGGLFRQKLTRINYPKALFFIGVFTIFISLVGMSRNGGYAYPYDSISGTAFNVSLAFSSLSFSASMRKKRISYFFLITFVFFLFIIKSRIGILASILSMCTLSKKKNIPLLMLLVSLVLFVSLFYTKMESTSGRFFIYKTTLSLQSSPEEILFGKGPNAFYKYYMLHQAVVLEGKPEEVRQRADNIHHPLSEFLMIYVNYGAIALCSISIMFFVFFYFLRKDSMAISILLTIIVFSLFSYPFRYPLAWISLAWCASRIRFKYGFKLKNGFLLKCFASFLGILLMLFSTREAYYNHIWKKAVDNSLLGQKCKSIIYYDKVYDWLNNDPKFQYNYALFLLKNDQVDNALKIILQCCVNDYDTEMIKGEIFSSKGQASDAILHYQRASNMCPNRFIPLFALYKEYCNASDTVQINYVRKLIIDKPVKIPSPIINHIKKEMYNQ